MCRFWPCFAVETDTPRGLDVALAVVLPAFLVLNAAFSLGLMEAVTQETVDHLGRTRLGFPADETAALSALHTRSFM